MYTKRREMYNNTLTRCRIAPSLGDADVVPEPQAVARGPDAGVPAGEAADGDAVLPGNGVARVAAADEVPPLAAAGGGGLGGRRGGRVAGVGGGRGRGRGGGGGGRGAWCARDA